MGLKKDLIVKHCKTKIQSYEGKITIKFNDNGMILEYLSITNNE